MAAVLFLIVVSSLDDLSADSVEGLLNTEPRRRLGVVRPGADPIGPVGRTSVASAHPWGWWSSACRGRQGRPQADSRPAFEGYVGGVATLRSAGGRLIKMAPPAQDALLAGGIAVAAQVETWVSDAFTAKIPMALLALAITVPVAWRRRFPVAVLGVGLLSGLTFGHYWPDIDRSIRSSRC